MRVKAVPPPGGIERLRTAHGAVPIVPADEATVTARLMRRLDCQRDEAGTWLSFLRGLGLVAEGARGYRRDRVEPDESDLAARLVDGVFGAEEVLEAVRTADEPLDVDGAFERLEGSVPPWERLRDPSWREAWRGRTADLLGWLAGLGLLERTDGRYRLP